MFSFRWCIWVIQLLISYMFAKMFKIRILCETMWITWTYGDYEKFIILSRISNLKRLHFVCLRIITFLFFFSLDIIFSTSKHFMTCRFKYTYLSLISDLRVKILIIDFSTMINSFYDGNFLINDINLRF